MKSISSVRISFVLSAVSLALLSACGGGGNGGGGSHFTNGTQAVAITSTNQPAVARAAVAGGFAVAQSQASGTSSAASVTSRVHAVQYAVRHAMDAATGRATIASAQPAANTSGTVNCASGGSFTTSLTDKDNNSKLSIGDVVTIAFTQCRDSSTESMNGTIAITVSALTDADHFVATAALQGLTVVDNTLSSTVNGTVTITEADTSQESDTTLVVGSGGLSVAESSSSYNDTIDFGNTTRIVTHALVSPAETTVTLDGTMSSTSIGGNITLATLQPILQLDTAAYPSSGQLRVTGASGSSLLLTVVNTTQVQLQLDADGDGKYEATSTALWSSLIP